MQAKRISVSLFIILIFALSFINGCGGKSDSATPLSSEKSITAYSVNGVAGTINETDKTIAVIMPSLTDVTALVATFTTTGASVRAGSTTQESGVTTNNFIVPLVYTVTAADGSTVTYTVTITVNRAWKHPASITDNISPDGSWVRHQQVAMDNNGNAIIAWNQSDGTNLQIFKSEYR